MPYISYIQPNSDIYSCPTPHPDLIVKPGDRIVLGDLHGNAMKLLYLLVLHGIIIDANAYTYRSLLNVYIKSPNSLTQDDLHQFYTQLNTFNYNASAHLILLGDDLADRGNNDYLTLLMIKVLRKKGVSMEILISNHSIEAIYCFEEAVDAEASDAACEAMVNFKSRTLKNADSRSLSAINTLIQRLVITQRDVVKLYIEFYRPTLRLMSYLFDDTQNRLCLLTHAPNGMDTVQRVARDDLIHQHFDGSSTAARKRSIDYINSQFLQLACRNQIRSLFSEHLLATVYFNKYTELVEFPLVSLACNRRLSSLVCPLDMDFVHGHCLETMNSPNVINLNTVLGQCNDGYQLALLPKGLSVDTFIELQPLTIYVEFAISLIHYAVLRWNKETGQMTKHVGKVSSTDLGLSDNSLLTLSQLTELMPILLSTLAACGHVQFGEYAVMYSSNHPFTETLRNQQIHQKRLEHKPILPVVTIEIPMERSIGTSDGSSPTSMNCSDFPLGNPPKANDFSIQGVSRQAMNRPLSSRTSRAAGTNDLVENKLTPLAAFSMYRPPYDGLTPSMQMPVSEEGSSSENSNLKELGYMDS